MLKCSKISIGYAVCNDSCPGLLSAWGLQTPQQLRQVNDSFLGEERRSRI